MPESTYHVLKVSLGLKRKYRISADDGSGKPGSSLGYAEKSSKWRTSWLSTAMSSAPRSW
jgi:hypothetical protein